MNAEKRTFLKEKLVALLRDIPVDAQPSWGKMTIQQIIEHLTDAVRIASGKFAQKVLTPQEKLPQMQAFLKSEQPMPRNFNNPLVPEVPAPVRNATVDQALNELQSEINHFFSLFEANRELTSIHPFFGVLDFDLNVQALYKHAVHHLEQFGVLVNMEAHNK